MTILDEILREEYERLDRGIRLLREEQTLLPEGYISEKQIGKHRYYYLQKREKSKIVSRHIKKDELEEYRKLIARRRELTRTIKDLQAEQSKIRAALRKVNSDD